MEIHLENAIGVGHEPLARLIEHAYHDMLGEVFRLWTMHFGYSEERFGDVFRRLDRHYDADESGGFNYNVGYCVALREAYRALTGHTLPDYPRGYPSAGGDPRAIEWM